MSQSLGFLVVQIQGHFQYCPDWYRGSEAVRALVGQYYVVLRSVLRNRPQLRCGLTRCRHGRIFFLTHACKARRRDVCCPFGCQRAHRRRGSTERSVAYYRTQEGKRKKRLHNGKRRQSLRAPRPRGAEGMRLDARLIGYIRTVTSWIEGQWLSKHEIVEMLQRAMRQHSLARRRRIEYVLSFWQEHAP
jgi:hypothetical protein